MKAKYIVTFLLVGLFTVGFQTGVLAGENPAENPELWEIQDPLETGASASADEGISRSAEYSKSDGFGAVEFGWVDFRDEIDNGG
jgi:hypothetical protein